MRPRRILALLGALALSLGLAGGCATLDEKQREWIFQPGDRTWGGGLAGAGDMQPVWIPLPGGDEAKMPEAARLQGVWLPQPDPQAPSLLYLHGARWDVYSSTGRMRRMHELGFAVLGIDYRGFGKSSPLLPSEASTVEDAEAAWRWLAEQRPAAARYLYGHSLGGAVAVQFAVKHKETAGLILEGTFTSIADVFSTMAWGWLPVGPLITQRFESGEHIAKVDAPVLIVHGSADRVISPALGQALYARAKEPKRLVLVEGGTHHNASAIGGQPYREAMRELFGFPATGHPGESRDPRVGGASRSSWIPASAGMTLSSR